MSPLLEEERIKRRGWRKESGRGKRGRDTVFARKKRVLINSCSATEEEGKRKCFRGQ